MASIQRIENKSGVTYRLTVTSGRDQSGKQIRHTKTWRPEPGMSERQVQKAVERAAFEFEQQLEQGYVADDRQTFEQYAAYVLEQKEQAGMRAKTIEHYRYCLKRINPEIGYLKLQEIRPQHLNRLYRSLAAPGKRNDQAKATPRAEIGKQLQAAGWSHAAAAKAAGISSATVDAICQGRTVNAESARKLCAALKEPKVERLFKLQKDERALSSKTVLEYHRCIHAILAQAEREMLVPYNAAAKATPPKLQRHDPSYFQPAQIMDILDALEDEPLKWRVIVHLLIVTGCRRGEIAALKWSKVDFKNEKIRIDATLLYSKERGVYENATKTGDVRFLKLPQETMQLLREYRREWSAQKLKIGDRWTGTQDYLFVQEDNGKPMPPDSITQWLRRFSERHDLPHIHPHAFRHTVASTLIHNGQDIVTVSRRLGHSRTSTTLDVYSHVIAEADADAADVIADTLLRKRA